MVKMKVLASNMSGLGVLLTLVNLCLLINALPAVQNVEISNDGGNRWARDESDKSSGSGDGFVLPVSRHRTTDERKFMGRQSDAPSKCGYEVRIISEKGSLRLQVLRILLQNKLEFCWIWIRTNGNVWGEKLKFGNKSKKLKFESYKNSNTMRNYFFFKNDRLVSELLSLTNPCINLIGNAHCAIIATNSSFFIRVKCSRAISVVPENKGRNAERSPCCSYARWRRLAENCGSVLLWKWVWSRPREKGCSLISSSSRRALAPGKNDSGRVKNGERLCASDNWKCWVWIWPEFTSSERHKPAWRYAKISDR